MRLTFIIVILLSLVACATNQKSDLEITKYKITIPEDLIKSSGGFSPGIGSGLQFNKKLENGDLEFFAISDRGPSYPLKNSKKLIIFSPQFTPKIVKVRVNSGTKAEVTDFMEIKYQGNSISGLNIHQNSQDEEFYDSNLQLITPMFGLDTESIAILKNGNIVVGDEYYPSINIIDQKNGEIIQRLLPNHGLPKIFENIHYNRGFESVTVAPNGKIYALSESTLNIDRNSNKNAKFIRMVELDLETNNIRTFAYPFDYHKYKNSSKAKIGDIAAIDNENFLLVEQGIGKDHQFHNIIYKINIKDATDITNFSLNNKKELEHASLEELQNVNFVSKAEVFNPRNHGWTHNKLEGLAIINSNTIAITNDNDFSIDGYKEEISKCADTKTSCIKITPIINQDSIKTDLWIIKFQNKF